MKYAFLISALLFSVLIHSAFACEHHETQSSDGNIYYNCGEVPAQARFKEEKLILSLDNVEYELKQVEAASGAKYESLPDATIKVTFWNKGDEATVDINGTAYPTCKEVVAHDGRHLEQYRASGNEPGWSVVHDAGQLTITMDNGEQQRIYAAGALSRQEGKAIFPIPSGQESDRLEIRYHQAAEKGLCRDSMSGLYYPDYASLILYGKQYEGCGEPLSEATPVVTYEIVGTNWQLVTLDGLPAASEGQPVTVMLNASGGIGGHGGCNHYGGSYLLEGEVLTITSPLMATRMACLSDILNKQEQQVMDMLSNVTRASLSDKGQLVLSTTEGKTMIWKKAD